MKTVTERRRSRRIPLSVPVNIESLEPLVVFYGQCNTVDVGMHGCQFFITRPFKRGMRLLLEIPHTKRTIPARVVRSIPAVPGMKGMLWKICVEFIQPGNYWDVEFSPPDGAP